MGVTIHYKFESKDTREALLQKLGRFRSDVEQIIGNKPVLKFFDELEAVAGYGSFDFERCLKNELGFNYQMAHHDRNVSNGEGFILDVPIMRGCEYFTIAMTRKKGSNVWEGWNFTKTQFADKPLVAHLRVIALLDTLNNEYGILKEVYDEGEYWNTRNVNVLANALNENLALIGAVGSVLTKMAEKTGGTLVMNKGKYVRKKDVKDATRFS